MATHGDAVETVRRRHEAWVWCWDKAPGTGRWDFRAVMGDYYNWDAPGRFYDDMDPGHRIARSPQEYQAIWEPVFNGLLAAEHRIEDGPVTEASGDLVVSRLVFVARIVPAEGEDIGLRANNSLVWRRFGASWKIVGDHTSSVRIGAADLEHLMVALRGPSDPRPAI